MNKNKKLYKKHFVNVVSDNLDIPKIKVKQVIDELFIVLKQEIENDNVIYIKNFGQFYKQIYLHPIMKTSKRIEFRKNRKW